MEGELHKYREYGTGVSSSVVGEPLSKSSQGKLKRSVKFYFVLIPVAVFFVSLAFGLLHHFYRYVWAGDIFYGSAILLVVVIFVELFLITFTR